MGIAKRVVPVLGVVLLFLAVLAPALAQESRVDVHEGGQVRSVVFIVGRDEYFVNGQTPGIKMDAKPFIDGQSGRTFVPIRYLAYGLGVAEKDVGWDPIRRQVMLKRGDVEAILAVGSRMLYRNRQPVVMDTAPQIPKGEGRTYLPARWVAEALGYQVEWLGDDRIVVCWPKDQPRPDEDIAKVKGYIAGQQQVSGPPKPGKVYTETISLEDWYRKPDEYVKQQEEIAKQYALAAKPYAGQPWDKSGWKFTDSRMFKGMDQIMVLSSVDDLKPNGVNLGTVDSPMVILDLWVKDGAVYIKAANYGGDAPSSPDMWLVEPGNVVRYEVSSPLSYAGNPFVHRYNFAYVIWSGEDGIPHTGWADGKQHDVSEFKGFLFDYGYRVLYVPNPAYKGGS